MTKDKKYPILIIGNFLSVKGSSRTIAEEFAQHLTNDGYRIISASGIRSRILRLFDMLFAAFWNRNQYQIAYLEVYSGRAFLWVETTCFLLDILKKNYILSLHGGNLPAFARLAPNRIKRLLQKAIFVTAPSQYLQQEMRAYRSDIILIPNPLEIKKYDFRLQTTPRPQLIWLRSFHEIYNPRMALRVIDNLRASFPNISLMMIGPDSGDGTLQKTQTLIESLNLQENITIIPGISKNDVPAYLYQSDIFINTTNIDNTPVSVMEAMACGLCVVTTNVGGIPYLLENEKDALLVPPDDAKAMAFAVRRILTEPGLAERLSLNARKKAERFDWAVVLPEWEKLFMEVTGTPQ